MAIMIKTPQEIEKMRRSGQVVREVLEHVRQFVKPGATTQDLENAAVAKMKELGAKPAFKGYRGYPCVLCTSVNEEVVHGIPSASRVLRDGDIVSIDTGVIHRRLLRRFGDHGGGGREGCPARQAPAGCDPGIARKRIGPSSRERRWAISELRYRKWLKPTASAWFASL